jgi:hypothetical protein
MLNTAKIFASIQKSFEHYQNKLQNYTPEHFFFKTSEEVWSLGQMYEHLLMSHSFFIYQIKNCLEKRKGQEGGEKNDFGNKILKENQFPDIKIKIPEKWRGPEPEAKNIEFYVENIPNALKNLEVLLDLIQKNDQTYKTLHVAAGWLSAIEWLQVVDMHARHHFKQQNELELYLIKN